MPRAAPPKVSAPALLRMQAAVSVFHVSSNVTDDRL